MSELSINAQGQATVVWSDTLNGTARTVGQVVTIPTALAVANSYLILGEVQYSYNPTFGYVLTNTLTLRIRSTCGRASRTRSRAPRRKVRYQAIGIRNRYQEERLMPDA